MGDKMYLFRTSIFLTIFFYVSSIALSTINISIGISELIRKNITKLLDKDTIIELPLLLMLIAISSMIILYFCYIKLKELRKSLDEEDETFGEFNLYGGLIFSFLSFVVSFLPIAFYIFTKVFKEEYSCGILLPMLIITIMIFYSIIILVKLILERI